MSRHTLSLAVAALLATASLVACSKQDATAPAAAETATETAPAATPAPAASEDAHPFMIGALQAYALRDGTIDKANDGKTFALGHPVEDVAAVLAGAGLPTDVFHLGVNPLLVQAGERVLLFDTGAGDAPWAQAGRLQAALAAAGFSAGQVTDIFISHAHGDHVGGLLDAAGAPAFANAVVHLSAPEWAALQADADAAALASAIGPKVQAFAPGASLVDGVVTAVPVDGHTAGHSAYEIASGEQRLLYIGDTAHHAVVSLQHPDWTIVFDGDAPLAEASRRALLQRAADQDLALYAVHFPFPGLGRVQARDGGFAWVPAP